MLELSLTISKLLAAYYLIISGLILYYDWKEKKKISLFLWGLGLLFWSLSSLVDVLFVFNNFKDNYYFISIRNLFITFAFILFILQGTATLVIPKKTTRKLSLVIFAVVLSLNFIIGALIPSYHLNIAVFNTYLINPISLIFFYYFFTHYDKLKLKEIRNVSLAWGAVFLCNLLFIISVVTKISLFISISQSFTYFAMIFVAYSYFYLQKSTHDIWERIITKTNYVVDEDFNHEISKYLGSKTDDIVERELKLINESQFSNLTDYEKKEIIENILLHEHFHDYSIQKLNIIKSELFSKLDLELSSDY